MGKKAKEESINSQLSIIPDDKDRKIADLEAENFRILGIYEEREAEIDRLRFLISSDTSAGEDMLRLEAEVERLRERKGMIASCLGIGNKKISDAYEEIERLREELAAKDERSLNYAEAIVKIAALEARLSSPTLVELGKLRGHLDTRWLVIDESGDYWYAGLVKVVDNEGISGFDTPQAAIDALVEKLREGAE